MLLCDVVVLQFCHRLKLCAAVVWRCCRDAVVWRCCRVMLLCDVVVVWCCCVTLLSCDAVVWRCCRVMMWCVRLCWVRMHFWVAWQLICWLNGSAQTFFLSLPFARNQELRKKLRHFWENRRMFGLRRSLITEILFSISNSQEFRNV